MYKHTSEIEAPFNKYSDSKSMIVIDDIVEVIGNAKIDEKTRSKLSRIFGKEISRDSVYPNQILDEISPTPLED